MHRGGVDEAVVPVGHVDHAVGRVLELVGVGGQTK
jgi:hypothetical protein